MNYLLLYLIFFKLGLFTIGGGLATLPLLQNEVYNRGWLSEVEFANIIAVSQSSPGPIGVNMATFVGFEQANLLGAIVATLGFVSPSILIITLIARFFFTINEKPSVQKIMLGIRPVVIGLIAAAAYFIARVTLLKTGAASTPDTLLSLIAWKELLMFAAILPLIINLKMHPIVFIIGGALVGAFLF